MSPKLHAHPAEIEPRLGTALDETLGRLVTFAKKIKKLPIVVNDGYAFYTTRVFSAYLLEAVPLVAEGHQPALIEWAARQAGMVVSPFKVFDEVTLTLAAKGFKQAEKFGRGHLDLAGASFVGEFQANSTELCRVTITNLLVTIETPPSC